MTGRMKRNIILLCLLSVCSLIVCAQEEMTETSVKGNGKVYMFGVCQQLTDTVVYITSICEVDSVDLDKKTSFLPMRAFFSDQLEEYVEKSLGRKNQTAAVFFSAKRNKLSKKLYKVKKYYLDNANNRVVALDESKFKFVHPFDLVK